MGGRGFYGDTFSYGFGGFETMKKRQQLQRRHILTQDAVDKLEVKLKYINIMN